MVKRRKTATDSAATTHLFFIVAGVVILAPVLGFLVSPIAGQAGTGKNPDPGFEKGVQAYLSGDLEEARQAFLDVLDRDPDNAAAGTMLGRTFFFLGNMEKAEEVLHQVLSRDSGRIDASKWLIRTYLEQGQMDKASVVVAEARERSMDDPELVLLHAEIAREQGNIPHALQLYRQAGLFSIQLAHASVETAVLFETFGAWNSAREELERALSLVKPGSDLEQAIRAVLERNPAHTASQNSTGGLE
jgi:tetratricopeptide (TPR) repeat protein